MPNYGVTVDNKRKSVRQTFVVTACDIFRAQKDIWKFLKQYNDKNGEIFDDFFIESILSDLHLLTDEYEGISVSIV